PLCRFHHSPLSHSPLWRTFPLRMHKLQTRFILAGALLVLTTVGSGLWSAWMFSRLSAIVGKTLQESQEIIDLAAHLACSLQREDDALLLAVSGNAEKAREELTRVRQRGKEFSDRLLPLLQGGTSAERRLALSLRAEMDAYRTAGDELVTTAQQPNAL